MRPQTFRHVIECRDWHEGRCYVRSAQFDIEIDTGALGRHLARRVFNSKDQALRYAGGAVRIKAHGTTRGSK